MNKLKKLLSMVLALALLLSLIPTFAAADNGNGSATGESSAIIEVDRAWAKAGKTVDVNILVKENPGILNALLEVSYDPSLILLDAEAGDTWTELDLAKPGNFSSPARFSWDGIDVDRENIHDGIILTLKFEVPANATPESVLSVDVSYRYGNVYDADGKYVTLETRGSGIRVLDYTPGDVNNDGFINPMDVTFMRRYITGGYTLKTFIENAANVNEDTMINPMDTTCIRRSITGGYGTILYPALVVCEHELQATAAKAPTCTEDGNIDYWYCPKCNMYFKDANATAAISEDKLTVPATGHTIVAYEPIAATYESEGREGGYHCSACDYVEVEPTVLPKLEKKTHSIIYHLDGDGNDKYLVQLNAAGKIQNPNPSFYYEVDGIDELKMPVADGYEFNGWFNSAGDKVTSIPANSTKNYELYAKWSVHPYTVQFRSDLYVEVNELTYTVDKGTVLPSPRLSNYVFAGWSDDTGHLYNGSAIPVGTTGNFTLTANWTSERNKTFTKTKLDDAFVVEDEENQQILFAFEIGEIQNVPLYTIKDFGYISGDGVTRTETETYSTSTTQATAVNIAKSVANATVKSSDWSLSSDWSESTSVNSEWCKENEISEEEANTLSKTQESNWNISSGTSGSVENTVVDSSSNELKSQAKIGNSTTDESQVTDYNKKSNSVTASLDSTLETSISATASLETSASIKGPIPGTPLSGEASTKAGLSSTVSEKTSVTAGLSDTASWETSHTGMQGHKDVVETEQTDSMGVTHLNSNSATYSSSWNNSSSYGGSNSTSVSETTKRALSESISEKTGYGRNYIQGGSSAETQGLEQSSSSSDEYSSSVTYSKVTSEQKTSTWTTQGTKPGYHRWIVAGTAHVFAVVGYDMKTDSYFVYTYSIMDDDTYEFEDYSYTSARYDDHENGVIPFEIPGCVYEYVANRMNWSYGLKVDMDTGTIVGYDADHTIVTIPEYMNVGDGDVIKITGLSASAFKGNENLRAVVLSDFITEIPDEAFMGCSSLLGVGGGSVTKVGKNAFKGCTSLIEAGVSEDLEVLGKTAFEGVQKLTAAPVSTTIAKAAAESGAENIVLNMDKLEDDGSDLSITVKEGTESFTFNGNGRSYDNISIESNAASTVISKANLVGGGAVPAKLSSPEVVLNQASVYGNGLGLVLTSENTHLGVQGTVNVSSESGSSMLCRNVSLYEYNPSAVGKLVVSGKTLMNGELTGRELFTGEIEYIDYDRFDKLLHSYNLYFNANGGSCTQQFKEVPNGVAVGTLPVPTREHFGFDGWYTAAEGGERITAASVFSTLQDMTAYAHWSPNQYSVTWDDTVGCTIKVSRTGSPYANAGSGELAKGAAVYYGDVLAVTYSEKTGFNMGSHGNTSITVSGNVTKSDIYAASTAKSYTVSWNTGTGYTISVSRTSSQYANAATGTLSNNSTVYYGDVLKVTYSAKTGYTLTINGNTDITVSGNVDKGSIYAEVSPNNYSYDILCKSVNGTVLRTYTETHAYGSSYTIYPPDISGYTTPAPQTIAWDSTSKKTITFTYGIVSQPTSQFAASGWWWQGNSSGSGITYSVNVEYQNRTASSIQIRVVWTQSIKSAAFGYNQKFYASCGSANTGEVTIATTRTWPYTSSSGPWHTGSVTAYSGWMTVPVSAMDTSVAVYADWWTDSQSSKGSWGANIAIPTY